MFRVVPPPIIRSADNCIHSIWYLSHRYCYLPLSWKSWNWFECAVGGVRYPQHTQTSSNSSTIVAGSSNSVPNTRCCGAVDTVVCAPDDGWWYHPKHAEQFQDKINHVTLHLVGYILEYSYDARTHERSILKSSGSYNRTLHLPLLAFRALLIIILYSEQQSHVSEDACPSCLINLTSK